LSGNGIVLFIREKTEEIKKNIYLIYLISRHPKTPFYVKLLIYGVLGYAFSPIDLIPDFIPVIGYLDDLLIVPVGIYIALKLVPEQVLNECRVNVNAAWNGGDDLPEKKIIAALIAVMWIVVLSAVIYCVIKFVY